MNLKHTQGTTTRATPATGGTTRAASGENPSRLQPGAGGHAPKSSDLTRLHTFERALLVSAARAARRLGSTVHAFEIRGYACRVEYVTDWREGSSTPGIWRRFVKPPNGEESYRGVVMGDDVEDAVEDVLGMVERDMSARRRGWGSIEEEQGVGFQIRMGLNLDSDEQPSGDTQPEPSGDGQSTDQPPALRRVPEAGSYRVQMLRLFHARGRQWEEHTGEVWGKPGEPGKRRDFIREHVGREVSSARLDGDALSTLADHLREDLVAAGFDAEAADRAYAERCAQREQLEAAGEREATEVVQ